MCYDSKARPPDPPGAKGSAHGEDIELVSEDGTRFMGYIARSGEPKGPQVLIYPDVRGLHQFYKELALRFAEQGIDALAIDYFGHSAGIGPRDDSFDFRSYLQDFQFPQFMADAAAGLNYLQQGEGSGRPTFVLGFCMGGALSVITGTRDFNLNGLIAFYAGVVREWAGSGGTVLSQADRVKYPVLGLFGGADQGIPMETVDALNAQLDKAGVFHDIVVYPGAPHSFFDRLYTQYADQSADAWVRVLDFIQEQSAAPGQA